MYGAACPSFGRHLKEKEAKSCFSHWEKQIVSCRASIIYTDSQQVYLSLPPYIY